MSGATITASEIAKNYLFNFFNYFASYRIKITQLKLQV